MAGKTRMWGGILGAALAVCALAVAAALIVRRRTEIPATHDGIPQVPPRGFDEDVAQEIIDSYARLMHATYAEAVGGASRLKAAVDAFAAAPTPESLEACKAAWTAGRSIYMRTETARFYEGPIDGGEGPEKLINAWPLDEAYIDYVEGNSSAGIIGDPARFPALDAETLRRANEEGGNANISTGWHAIEFLLWGQDREIGPGGGRRSHLDYVDGGGTAPNADRRRAYLKLCAEMLVSDLARVRDEWAPGRPTNYAAWFVASPKKLAVSKIITGIATLAYGELRGERLTVPFVTKDRENEHSCFSDTTHLDHVQDMMGMHDVWEGRCEFEGSRIGHRGPGLKDLARRSSPALTDEVERRMYACVEALRHPDLVPFEAAIQGFDSDPGRVALQNALACLSEFCNSLAALASQMDVPITTILKP